MASEIEICNIALLRVGVSRTINSFDEKSKEAGICRAFYYHVRDALLSDFPWRFAQKNKSLALLESSQIGWSYAYRYPADCLRIIKIISWLRNPTPAQSIQYQIGSDDKGRIILTDQEVAEISYVSQITNPANLDPLFVDAMAWKLAYEIALPLSAEVNLANNAYQQFQISLSVAQAKIFNEQQEPVQPDSEITLARLS